MVGERYRDGAMPRPGEITAAILAGGMGTRLRSVLPDSQKVLAPVCGRPFLDFLLDKLEAFGTSEVVLCAGHLAQDVAARFAGKRGAMNVRVSSEPAALGTAGALRHALPLLESEHVLVMNGDSYCTADLNDIYAAQFDGDREGTIALVHADDTADYGTVAVRADGRITEFVEKSGAAGSGWINAGVYLLRRELIASIPEGRPVSIETEMFPRWTGRRLFGFESDGVLLDIGTPARYAAAESFFTARENERGASVGN